MRSLNPQGSGHTFENDYDDAHYAFLASYTGHLATYDQGLMRLVGAIFPRMVARPHW